MRQFAEEEIVLPTGPHKDEHLRLDLAPWMGIWLDAIDSGNYRRHALTGVGQGGKTLGGSAIPVMYHLFERCETTIYAAPSIEMAADKWKQDIEPAIRASRYADLLPEVGRGSRGGTALSIEFRHGPTLRFMTGGGNDKTRAGYSARPVIITEVDGMDDAGGKSRETDKINQFEARGSSFNDDAIVYMECTVSTEDGRIWRELKEGTDSRLALPCPHCKAFVTPERQHLVGWQDAANVIEARQQATLVCPGCGAAWSEVDRAEANRGAKVVHKGQSIDPDGSVVGMLPPTLTFSLRFTAANNLLVSMARVAEEEWSAPRRTDPELAERKLRQFYWTIPSEPEVQTLSTIDVSKICARTISAPRGRVPAGATRLTVGVDVGKWMCHWAAVAWLAGGTPHVVEYGVLDVPCQSMAQELAIRAALNRFRDEICINGWPMLSAAKDAAGAEKVLRPSLTLIDCGNWQETVVAHCIESGAGVLPAKGFGVEQLGRRRIIREPGYELVSQDAGWSLVEINADFWKSFVHARLQTPAGEVGGLTLFHASAGEHLTFAKHLTAEKKVEQFIAGTGTVVRWERVNRNNHYLDALALACVAGHGVGERIVVPAPPAAAAAPAPAPPRPASDRDERRGWMGQKPSDWTNR